MATKRKRAKKRDPNQITANGKPDEDQALAIARTVLRPTVQAAVTLKEYGKSYGDLDLGGLIDSLSELTRASSDGDLKRAEAMLTAQAHTLDSIFNNLARRAINAEYMDSFDRYLKLALRAQSQSRASWEALAAIKNPPLAGYVRQANIAHGPQQVNNGSAPVDSAARAEENPNPQSKLLEQPNGQRLDTGEASAPGRDDPTMAPVGTVDGAAHQGW
jgi:hypothetical protein